MNVCGNQKKNLTVLGNFCPVQRLYISFFKGNQKCRVISISSAREFLAGRVVDVQRVMLPKFFCEQVAHYIVVITVVVRLIDTEKT